MYEVELKVEITAEERKEVISKLIQEGFSEKGSVVQNDHYIEAKKSPHGGYDLKRYRVEGEKIFYTQKTWEVTNGNKSRKEVEREATQNEFEEETKKATESITIKKERRSFEGTYQDIKIHIDMDSIKFDHSPATRYFIETEIVIAEQEKVKEMRELIRDFLKYILGKSEIDEAPGMFTMAFENI